MSIFRRRTKGLDSSDSDLVIASLGGDRNAYGVIVSRYQSLLCSLAYSSVGDLSFSEDIAQEAFVEGWKKLDTLKEPAKLKAWLCGILRFKVSHFRRKEANQPVKGADELDESRVQESKELKTEDAVIRNEEQALLWRAIENVPDTYREPLILFYREDRSTKQVADDLDLSEEAVKQRLSRGRKLLQAEMTRFVESTLKKSKPGAAFTTSVLAVIFSIPPPAKAASLGTAAVKAGSWLKWANVLTVVATFSGVISTFFGLRASLDQSRTQQERNAVFRTVAILFLYPLAFVAILFACRQLALGYSEYAGQIAIASQLMVIGFAVSYTIATIRILAGLSALRAQQRELHPEAFRDEVDRVDSRAREYRSRTRLAGVPLFHFRFGMPEQNEAPIVAWVAGGGEKAFGLLFAWGGIAVAPISVGIVSFGLISIGVVGFGLFGVGTVAIGVIGFGAAAIAYKAYASLSALGWESAFSQGISIAKEGAIGAVSIAEQANNEKAFEIANLTAVGQSYLWILGAIAVLVIVPAAWHSTKVRQRMGKKGRKD
ncbi:MAG: sigma-70 family RNA polymerase sigma factor [Xanthomonadales bacterium]|nr:sigma-70 family RNA polymerase sigma factor [Gammaproteobacteria bacterium]MBT8055200.1 sigma-70 family RNA polymerase sigma factor [Gammaproteobacteria bacterium]NND55804.1 sigma-70 family RNA polymerase sigma factor [Xanthomonadales bacterium]NNK51347.1 sigma-70 family RNA polymerase sigma factor [Xanthomonadales bacterium]